VLYEEALLTALEDRGSTPFSATVFRYVFASQPPLRPNVRGARWNPTDVAALYTSLDEATARAEIDFLIDSQPIRPSAELVLARIDVTLNGVIDLRDTRTLEVHFQLDLAALPDDRSGYPPCQEIGGAAAFIGRSGLLVPSMRRAGAANLVIFPVNLAPDMDSVELTPNDRA